MKKDEQDTKNIILSVGKYISYGLGFLILFYFVTKGKSGFEQGELLGKLMVVFAAVGIGIVLGKSAYRKRKEKKNVRN